MKHVATTKIGNSRLLLADVDTGALRLRRVDTVMSASPDVGAVLDALRQTGASRLVLIADQRLDPRRLAAVTDTLGFYRAVPLPAYEPTSKAGKEPPPIAWWFGKPSRRGLFAIQPVGPEWREEGRVDPRIAWLLGGISNREDVTLDPMMTDCAVGDACTDEGMRFVGLCPDMAAYGAACAQLRTRTAQGRLFGEPETAACLRQQALL